MTLARAGVLALGPVLLHALAREADRGLGLVLRAEVEPAGLVREVARAAAADGGAAAVRVALWLVAGAALWLGLAERRRRRDGIPRRDALLREAAAFSPLLLRPAITLLALVSLSVRASYPYGFTLPVALTQDWAIGQDAATLAAIVAMRLPALRLPAPRSGEVFLLTSSSTPCSCPTGRGAGRATPATSRSTCARRWPSATASRFDAEGVSTGMEDLPVRPLVETVPAAAGAVGRESWAMAVALARGEAGRGAIRATRITRQTVRGKDGGVYYVLAPGPSLMLAPALRLDRAMNRARGAPGRVAVAVLLWCALAAALVTALFRLVRDATGRAGLAAAVAFGFARRRPSSSTSSSSTRRWWGRWCSPWPSARSRSAPGRSRRHPWSFGTVLASLPWLHQKFLPVWLVLVATALWIAWQERTAAAGRRWAVGLLVPTALSLYLTALYNFAITGSVRPDALFLAWGPAGVTSARVGQGFLGLLLDARYGILPYVPVLALAAAGLVLGGARRVRRRDPGGRRLLPDRGLGRQLGRRRVQPRPLLHARGAPGRGSRRDRDRRGGARGRAGEARGGRPRPRPGGVDRALRPRALARPSRGERLRPPAGEEHVRRRQPVRPRPLHPTLGGRGARPLGPHRGVGRGPRRGGGAGCSGSRAGLRHSEARSGRSPFATLAAVAGFCLAAGLVLERWPGTRSAPSFAGRLAVAGASPAAVFFDGAAWVREGEAIVGPGRVELLLRSTEQPPGLVVTVGGQGGVLRAPGLPPLALRPTGALVSLPLVPYHVVRGRDGRSVAFSRTSLSVEGGSACSGRKWNRTGPGNVELR